MYYPGLSYTVLVRKEKDELYHDAIIINLLKYNTHCSK